MVQAGEIARNLQLSEAEKASPDTSSSKVELSDASMIALWQSMAELYGHRWLSAYGEPTETRRERTGEEVEVLTSALKTWRRALSGITREELAAGIRECVKRAEEWPPSAPVFRERCRPRREPYQRPEMQGPALPPPPRDRAVGRRALSDIYAMIGHSPHGEA